jgi:hypothetical protein
MVPHHDPTKQSDFPTGEPPLPGDTPQTAPPDNPAPAGGTNVPLLPVPCTVVLFLTEGEPPDNEPERDAPDLPDLGPRCPTCGTPRPPFHVRLSGLLDQALVAQEALSTLVHALEQEVLP